MDGSTELARAWPPAAPVLKDVNQGVGEGEWDVGNPIIRSAELGRQQGGWVMVVRAAAVRTLVRGMLRLREWEIGMGMSVMRRGWAPRPFIRVGWSGGVRVGRGSAGGGGDGH
jgi:hypothetical protein